MIALAARLASPRDDVARWGFCLAVAIAAHGALALALTLKLSSYSEFGVDAPVVTVELPESMVTAPTPRTDLPPGPKQEESEAAPMPKEDIKPPEPQVAEVAMPEPPKPKPPEEERQATAPPPAATAAVRRWESYLVAHIESLKRYPPEARARGDQGLARVAFTIDRSGRVLASHIVQSSGSPQLDEESLALLTRAQPMPRPPSGVTIAELSFVIPIRFKIR